MLTYYSGLCVCVWTITVSMNLIICNDDDDSDDDDYIGCNMYSSHEEFISTHTQFTLSLQSVGINFLCMSRAHTKRYLIYIHITR